MKLKLYGVRSWVIEARQTRSSIRDRRGRSGLGDEEFWKQVLISIPLAICRIFEIQVRLFSLCNSSIFATIPIVYWLIGLLVFHTVQQKRKRFQIWCDLPKEARSCSPRGSHSNNKPATAPSIAFYCPSSCVLPSFSIAFSCLPSLCIALCRLSPTVVLYQLELYLHSDSLLNPSSSKEKEGNGLQTSGKMTLIWPSGWYPVLLTNLKWVMRATMREG